LPRSLTRLLQSTVLAAAVLPAAVFPAAAQKPAGPLPLAAFAAQRVLVLPVQHLRSDTGSIVTAAGWGAFRKELDDSIGAQIADRGIGRGWGYAADVARTTKRNALYSGDPYALGAQPLRGVIPRPDDKVPQVLAGNIRTIIALGDARYVLLPIELRIERKGALQQAVLRLTLIDGRLGQFVWIGDVVSEQATVLTPSVINSLASRVADLIVAK